MNLNKPKSALTKLLTNLLLVCSITACKTIPVPEILLLNAQPKIASAAQLPSAGDGQGELLDRGRRRTYYLHVPKSYKKDQPLPLVLAFHGFGKQGKDMAAFTGLSNLAEQKGFIVVYPDGINKRWDIGGNPQPGVDDVSFFGALISHFTKILAIDKQRIYATGLSEGGFFVQRIACQRPGQIAAFASVAASLPVQLKQSCQKSPISILMINGTADPVVPWQGGKPPKVRIGKYLWLPPIPEAINFWRQHNGCASSREVKQLSASRVEVVRYPQCKAGTSVVLVTLKGGGHIWPGGSGPSQFLNASLEIWNFFSGHDLKNQS